MDLWVKDVRNLGGIVRKLWVGEADKEMIGFGREAEEFWVKGM